MTILLRVICSVTILFLLSSCANTIKFSSSLTRNEFSSDCATIKVNRSKNVFGAILEFGIQDGGTIIGELAPGGKLSWCRPPGYMAIVAYCFGFNDSDYVAPTHVLILPVEANKTYNFGTKVLFGGSVRLIHENITNELIKYELYGESAKKSIPDTWKRELEKLKSMQ